MPIEKPIKMGPNSYYFHGELWTAQEISERWGAALIPSCTTPDTTEAKTESRESTLTSA